MMSEEQARRVMEQLLDALAYLHSEKGVLHGDIKPENVLLAPERLGRDSSVSRGVFDVVKLCDFGHARFARDARYYKVTGRVDLVPYQHVTGTQGYIAPEVLRQQHYSTPVDMYALGVLLYEMLVGFLPFDPPTKCLTEDVAFPVSAWEGVSDSAQRFCAALLSRDPGCRPTAEEARSHPWMRPGVSAD